MLGAFPLSLLSGADAREFVVPANAERRVVARELREEYCWSLNRFHWFFLYPAKS
jgi:hypothetical protein